MRFTVSAPAKVTMTVRRGKVVVGTLTSTRRKAGSAWFTWRGKIKRGFAAKGTYKITVRAVPAKKGAAISDTATLRIT